MNKTSYQDYIYLKLGRQMFAVFGKALVFSLFACSLEKEENMGSEISCLFSCEQPP